MNEYCQRHKVFKERLNTFTLDEILRIKDNIDSICLDTFNYDEENNTYCPMAVGMNLDLTIKNPTDQSITAEIGKRFNPPNVLKGLAGHFYTSNRREDLLSLCEEVINERTCV